MPDTMVLKLGTCWEMKDIFKRLNEDIQLLFSLIFVQKIHQILLTIAMIKVIIKCTELQL